MNALNSTTQFKKLPLVIIITAISLLNIIPVLAQTNPHPSIFNEPPYNRFHNYRPKYKPKRKPKLGSDARLEQQPPSLPRGRRPSHNRPPASVPSLPTYEFRAPTPNPQPRDRVRRI